MSANNSPRRQEFKPSSEGTFQLNQENDDMGAISSDIPDSWSKSDCMLERREVLDYGNQVFLLDGLLSEEECQHLISMGEEIGFGKIDGARDDYRSAERILLKAPRLAELLWARISPELEEITVDGDPAPLHVHGIKYMLQGTWTPVALNPLFRLCRYHPGGHFAPHYDGHYVTSNEERSLKTCMLYLNGGFEGGSTNFVDEAQQLYKDEETGRYCAEEKNILCRLRPEAGRCLVFNHHRLHEGQALKSGVKYILRTDVMYRRTSRPATDEREDMAVLLLQQAERLEASGDCLKAAELYRKAFKLSPSLEESLGH